MQNRDYAQKNMLSAGEVREAGADFETKRKKFATQMDARLLQELRDYAKSEGRQIQAVLEDAVRALLKDKRGYTMRPNVKAAYEESLEQFDDLYKRLAQ